MIWKIGSLNVFWCWSRFLLLSFVYLLPLSSAQIYDCFTFFNETELLKVRLEELYDSVDHFVLVEATHTFCGESKPLYFAENRAQFKQYEDKIIHVVVDDFPPSTIDPCQDRWTREEFQRNAMLRGLTQCDPNDIILIGDLDEIPNQSAICKIRSFFENLKPLTVKQENQFVCELHMRLFLFYLDCESPLGWNGAVKAAPYWLVKKRLPWNLKILHMHDANLPKIYHAGWHFHGLLTNDQSLIVKLRSCYLYDSENWVHCADEFFNWTLDTYGFMIVPVDDSYPQYIRNHKGYFQRLGCFKGQAKENSGSSR